MEKAKKKLEDLVALWQEKRASKPMPSRGDLPVTVLRPWLGNLALIDLTGATPYFRLCGTALHKRFGGEMTRRRIDALADAHGKHTLCECIETARRTHTPAHMTHTQAREGGSTLYYELCAPLAYDGDTVDTVLFASYVKQPK
jgi:hypothetical protein